MNKRGFTLIELIAVLAVFAILLMIVMPNVSGIVKNARKTEIDVDARQVMKAIEAYNSFHQESKIDSSNPNMMKDLYDTSLKEYLSSGIKSDVGNWKYSDLEYYMQTETVSH